jgi:hypothetical protein
MEAIEMLPSVAMLVLVSDNTNDVATFLVTATVCCHRQFV